MGYSLNESGSGGSEESFSVDSNFAHSIISTPRFCNVVIKNLQKASAFHHCHYTKETLLRQQKTDSLKKTQKLQLEHVQSSNLFRDPKKGKRSVMLRCTTSVRCTRNGIRQKLPFPWAVCLRRGSFLYACGAGTAGYQPDCTKRIAQN